MNEYIHLRADVHGKLVDILVDKEAYEETLKECQDDGGNAGPEVYFVPTAVDVEVIGTCSVIYNEDPKPGQHPEQFGDA